MGTTCSSAMIVESEEANDRGCGGTRQLRSSHAPDASCPFGATFVLFLESACPHLHSSNRPTLSLHPTQRRQRSCTRPSSISLQVHYASSGERPRLITTLAPNPEEQQQRIRDQEKALVKLGELYRDQKCAFSRPSLLPLTRSRRNAHALSGVITLSRSFMSSTAKAKTAKLSAPQLLHRFSVHPLTSRSPNPPRLFQRHPRQRRHPETDPPRQHRMGKGRETHLPQAQSRDAACRNVRSSLPLFPSSAHPHRPSPFAVTSTPNNTAPPSPSSTPSSQNSNASTTK